MTGGERTCVPDALCVLLRSRGVAVDIEEVRSIMPAAPDQNTRFAKADECVERFGLTLGCGASKRAAAAAVAAGPPPAVTL